MPGINFDYTKFLRQQHEKYIKKYGDEPIKAELSPEPMVGYSGHVPYYRGSLHELRVVRSLVRCINSPMKPTTATGYRTKSRQFYRPEDEEHPPTPPPTARKSKEATNATSPKATETQTASRIRSAPAVLSREKLQNSQDQPRPSRISMMAAGSSALLKNGRPHTAMSRQGEPAPEPKSSSPKPKESSPRSSTRSSTSSVALLRLPTPPVIPKHPTGYPQTLYGSSFWYAWPGDTPRPKESRAGKRPDSFCRDRKLTRNDGVLYHRHEGMVPKYLGYVPGYKFRHGSTFGVLTVNATTLGVVHKTLAKT